MLPVIAVGAIALASYAAKAVEKLSFFNPAADNASVSKLETMVNPGFLDGILGEIVELCSGPMVSHTSGYAFSLFKVLLGLDFIIALIMGLIAFESGPNFLTLFMNKIFKYGFWTWILMHWSEYAGYITGSLEKVGAFSSDVPKDLMLHPGVMLNIGFDLSTSYLEFICDFGLKDFFAGFGLIILVRAILGFIAAVVIFCAFGLLALNIFLTTLEYYICMALMLIFIPFAVFDKTERFASQAFSLVVAAGTRMMVATALISITYSFFSRTAGMSGNGFNKIFVFKDSPSVILAMVAIIFVFIMVYLCCELPGIASSVISGSLSLTSNNAIMHAAGASMLAGKGINAVANAGATVGGAAMRAKDAYSAAQSANAAAVKSGGAVSALSPMGAAAKGFAAGLGSGTLEATFGGMEEAKRVGGAASGRKTSNESLNDKGELGKSATVTRDSAGNAISKSVNQDYTASEEQNGSSKSVSSGSNGNTGGSGGSSYVSAPNQGGSSSGSSGVSQEGQRGPQGDFGH